MSTTHGRLPAFSSPTSSDSTGGSRVLSNRAADNEIITSGSSDHVAGVQPPRKPTCKWIAEVVLLSMLILGVLSLFSIPAILHFYVSCMIAENTLLGVTTINFF